MTIKKREGFNIELMLAKLSQERTVNPDGSISTPRLGNLDKYESFLRTSIIAEGKSDAFVRSIVKIAVRAEQYLTEDKFIKQCNRIANIKMRDDRKIFKVVFPVWGGKGLIYGRRKWAGISITFDISQKSPFTRRAKLGSGPIDFVMEV